MLSSPNNLDSSFSELLRIGQAAHLLGVNTNTLRNWERQKKISSIRIGKRGDRRYRQTELLALLSSSDVVTPSATVATEKIQSSDVTSLTPHQLFKLISQQCLSLTEAAELTGYHEDYLGQRARLGELKAIKIGRNWITHRSSLNNFCKTHFRPYPHRPGKIKRSRQSKRRPAATK